MNIITHSENETCALASQFAAKLKGGEVILLNGRLGAGKTAFTKGLAKALGIEKSVTSPTFTIMKEYYGRLKLCHFDMYRIGDESETEELGLSDYLYEDGTVCVIEWNKFSDLREVIEINIEYIDENTRRFSVKGINL